MVKKILSMFLAIITIFTSMVFTPNTVNAAAIGDSVTVQTDQDSVQYGLYYGSPIGSALDYIVDENGVKSYAYCVDHNKKGVSEVGVYDVTLQPYDNEVVEGMLAYGFPNRNFGLTDKQAFYATKMAIVTYLEEWIIGGWSAGSGGNDAMINAMEEIYQAGKDYTRPNVTSSYKIEKISFNDEGIRREEYTYKIISDNNEDVTIKLTGDIPSGTEINGTTTNTATIKTNEEFKISYTKPEGEYTKSFKIVVEGEGTTGNVVLGVPTSPSDAGYQRYAITMQTTSSPIEESITYSNAPEPITPSGDLTIYKYENGTRIPLEGAVFEFRSLDGEISNVYTTDSNGQIVINDIKDGNYVLKEIQAPKGYVIDVDFPMNVILDSSSYPNGQEITIHNKKIPNMEIMKIDGETGLPLANATLEIAYNDGAEKTTVVTGADGKAKFEPPYIGWYTIKEITAPEEYLIEELPQNVYINGIDDVAVIFKNYKEPSTLITKHDLATGKRLPNAEFSIVNKDIGEVIYEGLTDENGEILVEGLDEGVYIISEIAPPENYIKVTDSREITVKAGKSYTVKFDNKLKPSLEIKKIDRETGEPLANATFKVEKLDGSFSTEFTTDSNGKILLEHIDEGVYQVTEIIAPNGYVLNSLPKTIDVKWQSDNTFVYSLIFDNYTKPSLIVEKYDEATNELLPNAQFRIECVDNNFLWESVLSKGEITAGSDNPISGTLEDGRIVINGLDEGVYKITEINPPSGYTFSDTTVNPRTVIIEKDKTTTVKIDNRPLPDLKITKTDSVTGEAIEGVTFEISRTDGEFVTQKQTDSNGVIEIVDMPEGYYTIKEISAPSNYIVDSANNTRNVQIKWNGGDKGDGQYELIFENTLKPTLVINKLSGLGGFGLSGARFEIKYRQNDGGLVNLGTYTTNSNGQIVMPYVNSGWYVVTEVKAPNGYQLPSNPTQEIYLSAGENSYSEIDTPNNANTGDITVDNGDMNNSFKVTYGADIEEIAGLFTTIDSVVYNSSLTFDNYPLNSIVIKKVDALTGELLNGATFELIKVAENVSGSGGTTIGTYTTDFTGVIVITGLESGYYIVRETKAPINYDMNVNNQQQAYIAEDGTSIVELMFANYPYGRLVINKMDTDTKQPLQGATFEVANSKGEYVGTSGTGHYTTDIEGVITIDNVPPDSYVVSEIKAPTNYAIDQENNVKVVEIGYGETKEVDFYNKAYSTVVIRKMDTDTKEMLAGAEFKVTTSTGEVVGNSNGIFTTDQDGLITISDLPVGTYLVNETKAPKNYILADSSQTVNVKGNTTHTLSFYNTKMSSAQILKIDSETKEPLKDAQFKIYKANGELVGTYTTDGDGLIILPYLENGWYKCVETKAPTGFILDDTAQDFEIKGNQFVKLVFENKKLTSLIIKKVKESDGSPLAGATFKVEKQNGTLVGEFTTDSDGLINIPTLTPDWYVVRETKAPEGFLLDSSPKTVEVKTNVPTVVTFANKQKSGFQIIKTDSLTGEPLSGAVFTVYKKSGEIIGEHTTDKNGVIILDSLENGYYKIAETKAPIGYQISESPKDIELTGDQFLKVTFTNTPLGVLKIIKTNSNTGEPIEGVEFEISHMNGKKVLNESNGTKFVTDSTGQIYLPNLADGTYTVVETKEADGYFIDASPKNVIVTAGKPTILEVPNTPASGLVIIKTDEKTGEPLSGVEFDILRADGSRVTADILDKNQPYTENNSPNKAVNGNGAVNGSYTTDSNGRIYLNHLAIGEYDIVETKAKDGYILDSTVYRVTVREGKQETLKITNKQMSSILIRKVDADTGEGLMGARFILYNESGTPIGEFRSDNEGWIHIDRELEYGKYFIEEVEAPEGYAKDSQRKTIYVQEGRTTNIVWENRMIGGQIQITKRSSDYNDVTKLPAGSALEGAIFEIYNTKGNVVDVVTTDYRGIGASKKLPTGVYFAKEIQAPQYYALNDKEMWVEISHDGDIVKLDVLNKSLYLDVNVRKQGPTTANAGDTITYHITDVQNNSNTPLTNFIIHDQIPVGAVRIEKIITGTFNERVNYSILYKTNKSGEYKTLVSNLLSKNSYEFSLHPNVLGLAQDEFVTDIKMEFPRVSQGFASLTSTQLKMYVLPTTAKGYEITNMATAGGYAGSTFEHAVSTWKTVIEKSMPKTSLPKTGY